MLNTDNANYTDNSVSDEKNILIGEYNSVFKYSNYRPEYFEFLCEQYVPDKYNYTQLLTAFLSVIYDLETQKINQLASEDYSPMNSDRIYILLKEIGFNAADLKIYLRSKQE